MSVRTWFTESNTDGVRGWDRSVMNRAVRLMFAPGEVPSREVLTLVRGTYAPGMSARELADAVLQTIKEN